MSAELSICLKAPFTPPPPLSSGGLNHRRRVWLYVGLVVLSTVALLGVSAPAGAVGGYGDVPEDRYFTEPVQWSVDNSITGLTGACFLPDRTVTRIEAARWLWVLQGRPEAPAHNFDDIEPDETGDNYISIYDDSESAAVSWMVHAGVTTGTSDTTFSPEDPLTRAQIAAFLWRIENEPEAPTHAFNDVHRPWQQGPVSWMSHRNITTGTSATTFSPETPLTRAHLVTFLWRYQNRPTVTINPGTPTCHTAADVTEGTCPGSTRVVVPGDMDEMLPWGAGTGYVYYRLPGGERHCTDGPAQIIYHNDNADEETYWLTVTSWCCDDGTAEADYHPDGPVRFEAYYLNGDLHRDDGPAAIQYNYDGMINYELYYLNGDLHRDDGPTQIGYHSDGTVSYELYYLNGERHRDDGPTQIGYHSDGTVSYELYYLNGERHRDDGPAEIGYHSDGTVNYEGYYRNGERYRFIWYNEDGTVESDTGP